MLLSSEPACHTHLLCSAAQRTGGAEGIYSVDVRVGLLGAGSIRNSILQLLNSNSSTEDGACKMLLCDAVTAASTGTTRLVSTSARSNPLPPAALAPSPSPSPAPLAPSPSPDPIQRATMYLSAAMLHSTIQDCFASFYFQQTDSTPIRSYYLQHD